MKTGLLHWKHRHIIQYLTWSWMVSKENPNSLTNGWNTKKTNWGLLFLHFPTLSFFLLLYRVLPACPPSLGLTGLEVASWMFSHFWEDELPWSELTERLEAEAPLIGSEKAGWARGPCSGDYWALGFMSLVAVVWKPESSRGRTESLLQKMIKSRNLQPFRHFTELWLTSSATTLSQLSCQKGCFQTTQFNTKYSPACVGLPVLKSQYTSSMSGCPHYHSRVSYKK